MLCKVRFKYDSSCDLKADRQLAQETTYYNSYYRLPDGRVIQIGNERFEAPEILFTPIKAGVEGDGAAELVFKSINVK
jgi:actin-related protein 2